MVSTTSKKHQAQADNPVTIVWHTCWTGACIGNGEPRPFKVLASPPHVIRISVEINGVQVTDARRSTKHHQAIREALKKSENFIAQLDAVRADLAALHKESLVVPKEEHVYRQYALYQKSESIYAEWEDWRTPLPQPEPMPQVTGKFGQDTQVLPLPKPEPATYAEWEAIPKPCGWKHVDGWWVQSSYGGRYNRLPDSVRQMYELSDRQVAILEGQIPVSVGEPKVGLVEGLEWADWMEGFSGEGFCTPEDLEEKGEASFMIRPEYLQ